MTDGFLVPCAEAFIEFTERRSRFMGSLRPVNTEREALDHVAQLKSQYPDASHHVYAYRMRDNQIMRHSDDGEPQGTAGLPVLEVLRRENVQNVSCVVVRYFGGVLLGAGGLTRAYARAAKESLDRAGIARLCPWTPVIFRCPYALWESVKRLLASCKVRESDVSFQEDVCFSGFIMAPYEEELRHGLQEFSGGRMQPDYEKTPVWMPETE